VRKQRGRWVVRIDGLDTENGCKRPRQLGTYDSRRAAQQAAVQLAESTSRASSRPLDSPPTTMNLAAGLVNRGRAAVHTSGSA
jgi:hypothetical protein